MVLLQTRLGRYVTFPRDRGSLGLLDAMVDIYGSGRCLRTGKETGLE